MSEASVSCGEGESKEAYARGRRGLFIDQYIWQKMPMPTAKEAYACGRRGLFVDLYIWQKRPMQMAKETYSST